MFVASVHQSASTLLSLPDSKAHNQEQRTALEEYAAIVPAHAPEKEFVEQERHMAYVKHTVLSKVMYDADTAIITLDGRLDCESGQFAFLWLPGIGEKPFSIAESEPFTFIIKKRGKISQVLVGMAAGATVYVRGVYGAPVALPQVEEALLIAGGTGVAVLPAMARKLAGQGTRLRILIGTSSKAPAGVPALMEDTLAQYGSFTCIPDDGKPARVLDYLETEVDIKPGTACFVVGPEKFMARAGKTLLASGIAPGNIQMSMEKMTLCGIGMCGACACGERLTCRYGTFVPYDYLLKEAPEFL